MLIQSANMKYTSAFSIASLVGTTIAGPVDKRQPLDLSLPPLIPAIPGVTEPLASGVPPLPILQVPTPPLVSPPFDVTEIRPRKIGYFWTGAGDNHHKDFLVTASLDDVSKRRLRRSSAYHCIVRTPLGP